jgi:aromatic ring hydroxylase
MPARTGAEYLNGLRERRELWFRGERVRDDARHPPTTGQPVSLAFIRRTR